MTGGNATAEGKVLHVVQVSLAPTDLRNRKKGRSNIYIPVFHIRVISSNEDCLDWVILKFYEVMFFV